MVDPARLEMGLDPTRAYFWPAVNKSPTRLWPRHFPTRPEAIFFDPKEKKIEKFDVFRRNFSNFNPNHKWLTRPDPTRATKNWPGPTRVKKFWPGPITTVFPLDTPSLFAVKYLTRHKMMSLQPKMHHGTKLRFIEYIDENSNISIFFLFIYCTNEGLFFCRDKTHSY